MYQNTSNNNNSSSLYKLTLNNNLNNPNYSPLLQQLHQQQQHQNEAASFTNQNNNHFKSLSLPANISQQNIITINTTNNYFGNKPESLSIATAASPTAAAASVTAAVPITIPIPVNSTINGASMQSPQSANSVLLPPPALASRFNTNEDLTISTSKSAWQTINGQVGYYHNNQMVNMTMIKSMPLPNGWQEAKTENGDCYYINHLTRTTQWEDPRLGTFIMICLYLALVKFNRSVFLS